MTFGPKGNLKTEIENQTPDTFKDDLLSNEDLDEGHAQSLCIEESFRDYSMHYTRRREDVYNPMLSPI